MDQAEITPRESAGLMKAMRVVIEQTVIRMARRNGWPVLPPQIKSKPIKVVNPVGDNPSQ